MEDKVPKAGVGKNSPKRAKQHPKPQQKINEAEAAEGGRREEGGENQAPRSAHRDGHEARGEEGPGSVLDGGRQGPGRVHDLVVRTDAATNIS
jgi:hypothetical protein